MEQWPPVRKHHKPRPHLSPEEQCVDSTVLNVHFRVDLIDALNLGYTIFRLASRHNALVQLGMVNSPSEVPEFAREL